MLKTTTLCLACKRPGTGSCSWDRQLKPVEGWTAELREFLCEDSVRDTTWHVISCPLYIKDRDPDQVNHPGDRKIDLGKLKYWIYAGANDPFIAHQMGISIETVRRWRNRIYKEKL